VVVVLNVLEKFRDVLELVLVKDEIENLWGHVLWSGHGELSKVAELEGATVIDEFDLF
jgi:hypothetical protein